MPTKHKRVMRAMEGHIEWAELSEALDTLEKCIHRGDRNAAVGLLKKLVPEYQPEIIVATAVA